MRTVPSSGFTSRRMGEPVLLPSPGAASSSSPPNASPCFPQPGETGAVSPAAAALSKSGSSLPEPPGIAELVVAGGSCCKQWCEAQAAFPIVPAVGAGLDPAARPSAVGHFVSAFVSG